MTCVKLDALKSVGPEFGGIQPQWREQNRPIFPLKKVAIERAQRAGVMFIAAAGNEAGGLKPLVGLCRCLGGDLEKSSQNDWSWYKLVKLLVIVYRK